jgi:hypothetical protein
MQVRVINFIPPIIGTEGEFNTFRLGGFYAKRLQPDEEIFLLNEKEKTVFGLTRVVKVETGPLGEMCLIHAHSNHSQLADDPVMAPERLYKKLERIYGPHIVSATKKCTVIYLTRIA